MKRNSKLFLGALASAFLIVGIASALPPETRTQPASASQTTAFDHSNCQYPDRWTNPIDGCDNSDPAVPECIKAFSTQQGEADCIAAFVAQQEQPAPIEPSGNTGELTQPVNQCGAK